MPPAQENDPRSRIVDPAGARGRLSERAPAKVNLTLRVLGRRDDGYHALASLVAFAGTGDRLHLFPDAPPGLDIEGARAADAGPAEANLVLRAAAALAARVPGLRGGRFHLIKRLPVSAGLGGGSSDAAAALRLLARLNGLALDDPRLGAAALETGSDVPACLFGRACLMSGRGEAVEGVRIAPLAAVLLNPGIPVATAHVFHALALRPGEFHAGVSHPANTELALDRTALLDLLRHLPNDLEPVARRMTPVLEEAARALAVTPGVRLVRMSGSGATMFALYDDCRAAAGAAKWLANAHPHWWVRPTVLR
ncbi:4-(cytidine 5'-diphospho)-2-C-methyl-D-erythritol kinase [Ancylobacter terrae]|uniref:4-(cytidine 5'-diphospho)-2-C-methyl-D-erythritol kinase n=1 Tax=Ancylobacter sp. sgz301288 TaxID=3342077 RepID=UPI00385CEFB7